MDDKVTESCDLSVSAERSKSKLSMEEVWYESVS